MIMRVGDATTIGVLAVVTVSGTVPVATGEPEAGGVSDICGS
jgi:hypothetical protein